MLEILDDPLYNEISMQTVILPIYMLYKHLQISVSIYRCKGFGSKHAWNVFIYEKGVILLQK